MLKYSIISYSPKSGNKKEVFPLFLEIQSDKWDYNFPRPNRKVICPSLILTAPVSCPVNQSKVKKIGQK